MREEGWIELDTRTLRAWPLPEVPHDADKEHRGRVLVVAGSREIAGAALLAGTAALRAGAGKLVIATVQSAAASLCIAMPEARVIGLPETASGALDLAGVEQLREAAQGADAAVVGPGFADEAATLSFVQALLPLLAQVPVVLDALAMNVVHELKRFEQPVILTPHAGEMARLCGSSKEDAKDDHEQVVQAARAWHAVVVRKGAETRIAHPASGRWVHRGHVPGLATSGSGDALAGIIGGLAARGAPPEQAAAWGVALHSRAGAALAARLGPLGLLARELPTQVPALMRRLRRRPARGS
jgi:hydroxyethylthiazole kinase-like uncharacterized protein yjeF